MNFYPVYAPLHRPSGRATVSHAGCVFCCRYGAAGGNRYCTLRDTVMLPVCGFNATDALSLYTHHRTAR